MKNKSVHASAEPITATVSKPNASTITLVSWRTLHLFNLYRLTIALVLLSVLSGKAFFFTYLIERRDHFIQLDICYFAFAFLFLLLAILKKPNFSLQIFIAIIVDIIILTAFIHCARGAIIFFVVLINAVIVGGSILTAGRQSIFFAAIASIAMLLSHLFELWRGYGDILNSQHIGIIGVTFFATGLLGYVLSKRIQFSEALAEKRGMALIELAKINDYVISRIHSGVIVLNQLQEVIVMNQSAQNLLDTQQKTFPTKLEMFSHALAQFLKQHLKKPENGRSLIFGSDNYPEIEIEIVPLATERLIGHIIFLEDATRITAEAQQIKLAALGRLTASIAHEIRNPLGALTQAAQLLEESALTQVNEKKLSNIIIKQSKNINDIIQSILELSRPGEVHSEQLELLSWLTTVLEPLSFILPVPLQATIDIIPRELVIWADPVALQRVIVNLVENGIRYSYKLTQQAKITIKAYTVKEGRETYIDIIDEGPGIDMAHRDRIFEPFFTTEASGTGLGLFIAKELCESSYAKLYYIPQVNQGACFRIVISNERLF